MKRVLIYLILLVVIFLSIFILFKIEMKDESGQGNIIGKVAENTDLPTPDRIIYKNKDGKYVIINSDDEEYQLIYNELYRRLNNIDDGKVYTEDEIDKMQEEGCFIEFDYNTKSKNFVFMLENLEIGVIKRFSDSGQVILRDLKNKDDLIKKLEKWTKDFPKYDFNREKTYTLEEQLDNIPSYTNLKEVKPEIYQDIIEYNELDYKNFIQILGIQSSKNLPEFDAEKETAVITISKYEIKNIKQNIGNIKYEFGDYQDKYSINILIVSKIVNINCIYYNINNTKSENSEIINSSDDEDYIVEYYVENGQYYANFNNKKVKIISLDKACDIADNEAKKEKYQYQSWKSEFYSRGKDKQDEAAVELISDLSIINKLYLWNKDWQVSDYKNTLMWQIRLFDENDPLTSLYIYVNAINGSIIGAGYSSD